MKIIKEVNLSDKSFEQSACVIIFCNYATHQSFCPLRISFYWLEFEK